ncbi:MAG: cupin domain-containing protein [Anaerolineae bacterium]|nr:cupin domain-containing protein [Anaerolineae bacterium]
MQILKRDQAPPFVGADEGIVREIVAPKNSLFDRGSLAEITVEPGKTIVPHRHRTTHELYYILRGEGLMQVGDERAAVGPGDAIPIPERTRHQMWNRGREDLVFLCVCIPAWQAEDVELLGES